MSVTFKLGGTIPTTQYGNLQPEYEVQADTQEEAEAKAIQFMEQFWNRVCEPGRELKVAQPVGSVPAQTNSYVKMVCEVSGTEVDFDEVAHKYFDNQGNRYLSGSAFSGKYKEPFPADFIAGRTATKHGVEKQDVLSMWSLNGETSTSLGTAIHNALELYGKYLGLSNKTKGTNESALHRSEILRPIVEAFYNGRENENAKYEVFVADEKHMLCGSIDRLLIVDEKKKVCRVQDYKTNTDINKKQGILEPFKTVVDNTMLGAYWLQLSFYAYVLKQHGWTVEGLDIFNYEGGEWKTYQHDVIDISAQVEN